MSWGCGLGLTRSPRARARRSDPVLHVLDQVIQLRTDSREEQRREHDRKDADDPDQEQASDYRGAITAGAGQEHERARELVMQALSKIVGDRREEQEERDRE